MGKLYVVATPIGNMGDISPRAIETLKAVDIILAEDTRTTSGLCKPLGIQKQLVSLHKFNERERQEFVINEIVEKGKNIALVSDAGTPCISDPGSILVAFAHKAGVEVVAVPGCSSVIAALSMTGFDLKEFAYLGFLPRTPKDFGIVVERIRELNCPVVLFESPMRILKSLEKLATEFESAEVCICNDITKKFEKNYVGKIDAVQKELQNNENATKGEYVVVMQPNIEKAKAMESELSLEGYLVDEVIKSGCTIKDAVVFVAERLNIGKNDVYKASLNLKEIIRKI